VPQRRRPFAVCERRWVYGALQTQREEKGRGDGFVIATAGKRKYDPSRGVTSIISEKLSWERRSLEMNLSRNSRQKRGNSFPRWGPKKPVQTPTTARKRKKKKVTPSRIRRAGKERSFKKVRAFFSVSREKGKIVAGSDRSPTAQA